MSGRMKPMPRWPLRLLKLFCPPQLFEEIEGDLEQIYNRDVTLVGEKRANRRIAWRAIRFFRPGIIMRNRISFRFAETSIIASYFTVAIRHLIRSKTFSLINVIGLAIGVSAFVLIAQYVSFETSFDNYHPNGDRIYRVALERYKDGALQSASTENFAGLRKLLRDDFPELTAATGFYKTPANTGVLFSYKGKIFNELGGELNADSSFFKVFPGLLVRGDPMTALNDPHSIVLTEKVAKKVFGDVDPMGLQIQFPNDGDRPPEYTVTGILKELPENSHFHAKFVVPLQYISGQQNEWKQDYLLTYISLGNGSDPARFAERLTSVYEKLAEQYPTVADTKPLVQPITSIHLDSHLSDELEANGSWQLVYLSCFIALVILVLAWINYINLQTARFVTRAREVGVRRVIGSAKSDLAMQFFVEYLCILVLALALAAVLVNFIVPYFSFVTGIPIGAIEWSRPEVWIAALVIVLGGSIIAGTYPAVFLYRLNPVAAIKGKLGEANRGRSLRRVLIVIQFCSSLILVACVMVVNRQLDFMRVANRKFDVDRVITLRNPTAYSSDEIKAKNRDYRALETELLQHASTKMVTSSSAIPGTEIGFTYVNLLKRDKNDPFDPTRFKTLFIDYNYIPFFGLKLLAGRNFDPPRPADNWIDPWEDEHWLSIILNETAIHALGFNSPAEAVDQIVEFHNFGDDFQKHRIIGVIEDYHHEAIKKPVLPMILSPNYGSFQQVYYSIRLNPGADLEDGLRDIQESWTKIFPERPFDYYFLDSYYDAQFKSELHTKRTFSIFAGIAILLGCLGILGMTLFEANARLKEISIRKVLGASASSLVALLSRENIRLVIVASIISVPIIYFVTREWLATYPVGIDISMGVFLIPVLSILLMVLGTASVETIKAASANPVDHLKNDL